VSFFAKKRVYVMETVSPVYARIISRHLRQLGCGEEEIFMSSGLSEEKLRTESELPLQKFRQLLENASRLQTDIPVGFLMGRHHNVMSLGLIGSVVAAAPSVRNGLQALESFTRLQASYIRMALRSGISGMSLHFEFTVNSEATLIAHAEAALMYIQWYVETVSGLTLNDASYRLTYSEPPHAEQYRQYLHGTALFSQEEISFELPMHYLDSASPYYNEEMWRLSKMYLSRRLRELGAREQDIYSQHVRARLRSYEPPFPTLQTIANELHVSERTLNRRLQSEGTSFRHLRGELIHQWAQIHLRETDSSVESIALTLGFQDPANFRRSFRARFGVTPSEFRQSGAGKSRPVKTPLPDDAIK
jgi:AraC-like DNA-binding protein